tara:strand:+ start:238 stop:588 length:351 start_codon:yes stop_codon:yes gene_type:complete
MSNNGYAFEDEVLDDMTDVDNIDRDNINNTRHTSINRRERRDRYERARNKERYEKEVAKAYDAAFNLLRLNKKSKQKKATYQKTKSKSILKEARGKTQKKKKKRHKKRTISQRSKK